MKFKEKNKAVLLLADGKQFNGVQAGAVGTTTGEICFNTGMTGYQEIFTDPSYYGQILTMTPAHIGNYGIHLEEVESTSVKIAGLVCKKFSDIFSRASAVESIQDYFEKQELVGISDVDTRALVRYIREKGAMNAVISSDDKSIDELKAILADTPSMEGLELSSKVTTTEPFEFGDKDATHKIAVLDLGVKTNILRCLADRGAHLKVFPMDATLAEMEEWNPDGYMISNGPGDPGAMDSTVKLVDEIANNGKPTFGICLGHQVLAISQGLSTSKMHNGHRGINHPIVNLETGKSEVTTQNHGFVVDQPADENKVKVTHRHLNDDTVAGIKLTNKPVFSVQYHPESSSGPNDSRYLFDQFIELIATHKN